MNKELIESTYSKILNNMYFTEYEKGIDQEGWYSNERNDKWLPLSPNQTKLFDFRNDNTEIRPKSLSNYVTLNTSQRMFIADEILNKYSMLKKDKGIFHAQLFSAMDEYLKECTKNNLTITGL